MKADDRSPERIRAHYDIERALAARLRTAKKAERPHLYTAVYDEMFQRVPDHPQLTQKSSPALTRRQVSRQLGLLARFLTPSTTFVEVGPGDCALSFAVAKRVKHVYGVDVSEEITRRSDVPANFTLLRTDGSSIALPAGTADVVYSNQLFEHLHPEDAQGHLREVHRVLAPGGRYVCVTPNAMSGPWDVSAHFERTASGFHLKEYSVGELGGLLRDARFDTVATYVGARGLYTRVPCSAIVLLEKVLARLPGDLGWVLAHTAPVRVLLGMRLVATKRA